MLCDNIAFQKLVVWHSLGPLATTLSSQDACVMLIVNRKEEDENAWVNARCARAAAAGGRHKLLGDPRTLFVCLHVCYCLLQ